MIRSFVPCDLPEYLAIEQSTATRPICPVLCSGAFPTRIQASDCGRRISSNPDATLEMLYERRHVDPFAYSEINSMVR
jgi:hypothetical protein